MPVLTATTLQQYKAHPTNRREIRDHGGPSLYLCIQPKPSGARSWVLRFRDAAGKSCKLTLGPVDDGDDAKSNDDAPPVVGAPLSLTDARILANQLMREKARGNDLVGKYTRSRQKAAADAEAGGFRALAVEFFASHKVKRSAERPRRWRQDARLLGLVWERDADPAKTEPVVLPGSLADIWGSRAVEQITRHEIEDVVSDARAKAIPGLGANNPDVSENRARKLHAVLSVFFGWLARRRFIDSDPTAAIEAPHAPKARNRILDDREKRWFLAAAAKQGYPYGHAAHLLLLCGQRLVETSGMQRSELNEDASLWRIPGARSKNHREHLLPMPVAGRQVVESALNSATKDCPFVFTANGKTAATGWNHFKLRVDDDMAEIAKQETGKAVKIDHFVLHDLRRSCASGLQHIGVAPQVIERALNHSSGPLSGGISAVYQRDPLTEDVRAALSSWSRYLSLVVDAKLHTAHEKFLMQGDDDERSRNLQHFRDCISAGGDRWQGYIDTLSGEKPPKLADFSTERRRRSK